MQLLLEELRTVKATNARRIAELKEELSTVRKVLVTYVRQVDSLTAVNSKLEAENRKVQQRYEKATEEVKTLSEERERLVEKVTIKWYNYNIKKAKENPYYEFRTKNI